MSLYPRILSYLRPYLGVFALAVLATSIFAALDAFSLTLRGRALAVHGE